VSNSSKNASINSTKAHSLPGDEIPGFTTYLYGENRFRKPGEFVGDEEEGLTVEDLLVDLNKLSKELRKAHKSKERLQGLIDNDTHPKIKQLEGDIVELNKRCDAKDKSIASTMQKLSDTIAEYNRRIAETAVSHKSVTDSLGGQIIAKNGEIADLQAAAKIYQDAGQSLGDMLLEFGDHKQECDWWELKSSGRLIDTPIDQICTCDWYTIKVMVEQSKDKGQSGQIKEEDVKLLIDHYKGQ